MHLQSSLLASFLSVILTIFSFPSPSAAEFHTPNVPTTWEKIHTILTQYARAIDSKDFALLSSIFTADAQANYTSYISHLAGLPAIQSALQTAVAQIDTQHLLGSITIDITDGGEVALANSTTYFQASLFGKGNLTGKVLYQYGYYVDDLLLVQGEGWRIRKRELVFQGPGMVGDLAVIGQ